MNTPAQCGVIKPPKTDIYSEAPDIATAEADGQFRLADNHRLVHDNLDRLIAALEDTGDTTP